MDKRKLIGTIIGVTMFAALIAGATFAWLTFNASVTNGTYDATAENFIITYSGGTNITSMLDVVNAPTVSNVTKKIRVSAHRANNTSTGTLYLKLTTSSTGTLTTGSVVRYAVCSGTSSASGCTGNLADGQTGVLATGSVNRTGAIGKNVSNDSTCNTSDCYIYKTTTISTSATYYYIYLWIDAATFSHDPEHPENSHLNQSFSAYVHAKAVQN